MIRTAILTLLIAAGPASADAALSAVYRGEAAVGAIAESHAALLEAKRVARRGDLDAAARAFDGIGLPAQLSWRGPAPNTSGTEFRAPLPEELAGEGGVVRRDPREGWFDLGAQLPSRGEVRLEAELVIESEREQAVALRLGVSGQARVDIAGREVLSVDRDGEAALDQFVAGAWLARGRNRVVLRLGNVSGGLELFLRVTRPDGGPLTGVRFDLGAAGAKPVTKAAPIVVNPLASLTPKDAALAKALALGDARAPVPLVAELAGRWADGGADALTLAGESWLGRDATQASSSFERALALEPDHLGALLGLAHVYEEQERPEAARRTYERARRAAPDDPRALEAAWLNAQMVSSRRAEATRALKEVTRAHPTPLLLAVSIDEAERVGDTEWRQFCLEKLAADDVAGSALLAARRREAEARAAESGDGRALLALLALQLAHHPADHRAAESLALALFNDGEHAAADTLVLERQRDFPARAEPSMAAASLALLRGDRLGARRAAADAARRAPGRASTLRLLRALVGDDPPLVDVAAAAEARPLVGAIEAGAEVLQKAIRVEVIAGGLGSTVRERVLRVHAPKRAPGARTLSIPFTEGREIVSVVEAYRLSTTGARVAAEVRRLSDEGKVDGVYTDQRAAVIDFGAPQAGDLLVSRVRIDRIGQRWFFGSFFGVVESIADRWPVGHFSLEVVAPREVPLVDDGVGFTRELSEAGEERTVRYSAREVPRVVLEPDMPPWIEVAPYVAVSTVEAWGDLAAWYRGLVEPQLVTDAALATLARSLTEGASSEREKVRRIYEHVVRKVRYVGIELGIHGWRPYAVTEVNRRGYGDCKDTASLLVALLGLVDVEARLVLVRTRDRGRPPASPPSMWMFNHAIAYVPALDLYLDGTATDAGLTELPVLDRGAFALVIPPAGREASPRVIPLGAPDANENRSRYRVQLDVDGGARIEGEERFSGTRAAEMRALLARADAATITEAQLAQVFPGASVESLQPTSLRLADGAVGYDLIAHAPRLATARGAGLVVPITLYAHELEARYGRRSSRTHDLVLGVPGRTINDMRFVAPPGFAVQGLPTGGVVDAGALVFTQAITATEDGWRVIETLETRAERVPAADYATFREQLRAADALMGVELTFVPEGAS